jgi:dTDP-4-dehydrorhamnose reductase
MSFTYALVIGASGQVARSLREHLERKGKTALFTSSSGKSNYKLDLAEPESIRGFFSALPVEMRGPNTELFLPGALTHVDRCESEQEFCRKINLDGPKLVAEQAKLYGMGITFFSTEYVFGGAEYEGGAIGPFSEEDAPFPTSYYGKCKLEAEQAILKLDPTALVVRTTMVYSWDPSGLNFFMQFYRRLEQAQKGAEILAPFRVPMDQVSTPTYAPALAESVLLLRERKIGGIVNLVGPDLLSRKELLERMARSFGFQSLAGFEFPLTKQLGQIAKRPLRAGLTSEKARALGLPIIGLEAAFAEIKIKI